MGALRAAQWQYDNQLPPPVSESAAEEAEARWFDDGIAELLARRNVVFQRNFHQRGVTYERFAQAVDEFAMGQLEEIARQLLTPFAKETVLAQAEDAE
ncbi:MULTISPECIES: hypothetical protein [Pseudomonas]|uniref:hypothetical protein n=1 Tax=Pseudomonas TaxID=286 RepID=UPI000A1D7D13|nr:MULTISPECIES: hypothetical protein [Pseudomonas]MDM9552153.1 hypothetical protein [Pseudomonas asiatica]MDV5097328.1 hypothetical protein [Pseudomonas sp. LSJ-87]TXI07088.1 MAG: hypothetical protein E6Q70_06230 [Pseudomonas monteilii]